MLFVFIVEEVTILQYLEKKMCSVKEDSKCNIAVLCDF